MRLYLEKRGGRECQPVYQGMSLFSLEKKIVNVLWSAWKCLFRFKKENKWVSRLPKKNEMLLAVKINQWALIVYLFW